ncbi:MAG: hypothetical protein BZY81_01055 [SAR202 cluster bacterium Io17-Chloro-G4]|nr:MAG: hypothetical protein BZY81_01055 [SAR202 cluster bacterium Io17-Chloro-G4]
MRYRLLWIPAYAGMTEVYSLGLQAIQSVSPAEAGVQELIRHRLLWIPAFAGMTGVYSLGLQAHQSVSPAEAGV